VFIAFIKLARLMQYKAVEKGAAGSQLTNPAQRMLRHFA
jgi:hypothetical protein